MKIIAFTIISILIITMGLSHANVSKPYSPIPGKFKVDGKGSASYQLPVEVIKSKFAPSLGLSYSSQGGDSYVGSGWSLSGVPVVQICPLNKRQDNTWSNLKLNMGVDDYAVNRFCIGGSRLSVIKGKYGEDKSVYQTELLSKQLITANGKCGEGPCSFTIQKANGVVDTYGGTPNSTVQLEDKDILIWGMRKSLDRYGNSIKFNYLNSAKTNILYPSIINYFNIDDATSRKIMFSYKDREKTAKQHKKIGLGGYSLRPAFILTTITTENTGKNGVFNYNLVTDYDKFADVYNLVSVTKTSASGSKDAQSTFTQSFSYKDYQPGSPGFTLVNTVQLGSAPLDWNGWKTIIIDKYGDGYPGVGIISRESDHAMFRFARSDENGKLSVAHDSIDLGEYSPTDKSEDAYTFLSFDKNGDGISDLIKIYKGGDGLTYARTYLSVAGKPNFSTEEYIQELGSPYIDSGKGKSSYVGRDINGDGLKDIVEMTPSSKEDNATYLITVHYADVKGGFPKKELINNQISGTVVPSVDQSINFVDVDADTVSDFFLMTSAKPVMMATPLYNRQGKFLSPSDSRGRLMELGPVGDWEGIPAYKFIDFNGDGLSDIVKFNYTKGSPITGQIYMNSGHLFDKMANKSGVNDNTTKPFIISDGEESPQNVRDAHFTDINGDGQPDILKYMGGNNDSSDDNLSYFETYIHTGDTYVKGPNTGLFGAHTRNIPANMGDNPLSDIVSVNNSGGIITLSVYANQLKQYKTELIKINNGNNLTYDIEYKKISPFIDYGKMKQPDYPEILLSRVRNVVISYTKSQDINTDHGFSRKHEYKYSHPIYNKHDWMFSGYRTVDETIKSLDKWLVHNYFTTYPMRGKIESITTKQLSTGIPFSKKSNTYKFNIKYPDVDPKVVLIYKDSETSTIYQDSQGVTPDAAWTNSKQYTIDDSWGINVGTVTWTNGSDNALYECNRYISNTKTGLFLLGQETGHLFTSHKSRCDLFAGENTADAPFDVSTDDLELTFKRYSDDGLFNMVASMKYSSDNNGYHTQQLTYDKQGNVIQTLMSQEYTPLSGVFPSKDKLKTTTYEFGTDGYVAKKSINKLVTEYETNSDFGVHTKVTDPNGIVTKYTLDELGTIVGVNKNGIDTSTVVYDFDADGRFRQVNNKVGDGVVVTKKYLNAVDKQWKSETITEDKKVLTKGEIKLDKLTGQIIRKYAPYFDKSKAMFSVSEYGPRWAVSKETHGQDIKVFERTYTEDILTVVHKGNDPSHKEKGLVVLGTKSHNKVLDTESHTTPNGVTSVGYYDLMGNMFKATDYRGFTATHTFDMNGKGIESVTPDSGKETYKWNGLGKVVNHGHLGWKVDYEYDNNLRLIKTSRKEDSAKAPLVTTYTWDTPVKGFFNNGRMTNSTQGDVQNNINYNVYGLKASKEWVVGTDKYNFTYSYFEGGVPSSMTYPDGSKLSYAYTPFGELESMQYEDGKSKPDNSDKISFSDYGLNAQPGTITYGNSLVLSRELDSWGRESKDTLTNGKTVLDSMEYVWDNTSNITSQVRNGDATTYTYDTSERLTGATNKSRTLTYEYDSNDNLTKNGANTFVMDTKTNRLANGVVNGKPIVFKYDVSGRLLGDGEETYTYGDSGRLELIVDASGGETHIGYFNKNKLSSTSKSRTALYLDNGLEITTQDKATLYTKRLQIGGQTWEVINGDGTASYVFPDRLRSQLRTIDSKSLDSTSSFEYEPYGASHEVK